MNRRVSIGEIIQATGLSRATVDRALNERGGIHPRTKKVIQQAIERLGQSAAEDAAESATSSLADAVLRLGRGLSVQIEAARENLGLPITFVDMCQRNEDDMLDAVSDACKEASRPLIVTAKNSERMNAILMQARRRGKRIVTLVSDLPHSSRDAFVGIDNRMAGQTAAYVIGNLLREKESATVGVVLGDYAFNCHEDREIGFRSHLRANFPGVRLTDVAKGEDSAEQTYEAVHDLLEKHPDISALYNVGGGNIGLAKALRERDLAGRIQVVSHEANHITVPLAREDVLQYLIAQEPAELIELAVDVALSEGTHLAKEQHLVDFGIHTRFNLPKYGLEIIE